MSVGREVDVAAAGPVDPLPDPHPLRPVAPARAAPSARGRGCARRWSPAAAPARRLPAGRRVRSAGRSSGWGRGGGRIPPRRRGFPPLRRPPRGRASPGTAPGRRLESASSRRPGYPDPLVSSLDRERASRELPNRAPGRGRSRDRRGPRRRAAAPAAHAGDDRLGELRAAGGARRGRLGADQQVRRGLPRPPLLRRLRGGRRRRAAGDRPRQGAVRRRARQRPGRTPAPRPTTPPTWR